MALSFGGGSHNDCYSTMFAIDLVCRLRLMCISNLGFPKAEVRYCMSLGDRLRSLIEPSCFSTEDSPFYMIYHTWAMFQYKDALSPPLEKLW